MSEVRLDTEDFGAATTVAPIGAEAAGLERTPALSALLGMRAITRGLDRAYLVMGWICGLELLLLGFFITYQVIARKVGWVQAPATDVMSGYVLAMAATWAFSYALRSGAHVRIDVLLPFMGQKTRALADFLSLAAVAFLASITAWKMWVTIIHNYNIHAVTNDYPLTPLWIPKIVVGLGFSFLGFTAIQMMVAMLAEGFLPQIHKLMGGGEVATEQIITSELPSTVA